MCVYAVLLTRDFLGRKFCFDLGGIWNLAFIAPYIWILGWLSWHKIQIYDNKEFLISQTIAQIQIDGVNKYQISHTTPIVGDFSPNAKS